MQLYDLVLCVVNHGKGSAALQIAKQSGARGGTLFLGTGTVQSRLLEFLELTDIRKEIMISAVERELSKNVLTTLERQLSLQKPGHGIAVSVPLKGFLGTGHLTYEDEQEGAVTQPMYRAIFTVVDKGAAQDVVAGAKEAGARGGTIIHARGSGIHETERLFAMPIEPEKEVVMTIVHEKIADAVISAIRKSAHIDEHGKGVLFVVGVSDAMGLY